MAKKKKALAKKRMPGSPRSDYGRPIDGFFKKQPPHLRAILVELRKLIEEEVPDAESAIKWGMPWYSVNGKMTISLSAHRAHVNLILAAPPKNLADPKGLLSGESKLGRHLKLTSADGIPRAAIRGWLRATAAHVRKAR